MQFLIDTDTESRAGLLMASQVMALLARGLTDEDSATETEAAAAPRPIKVPTPPPPVGKPAAPAAPAPLPPNAAPPPPVVHPPIHPDAQPKVDDVPTGTDIDPAVLFGGNRAPLAPPAPGVATAPAAPVANVAGAPVAAAGTATNQSATVAPPANAAVDSEGIPWDARIHSETRKTNADGTWRYRRNLDAAVKQAVYAELKAAAGQQVSPPAAPVGATGTSHIPMVAPPPPAAVAPPPPAAEVVAPPPPASATVLPFPSPAPAAPPVPVQPATALGMPNAGQPPVVQAVTSFRDLMQKVNVALAAGKLTQPQLAEACKLAGVDSVTALAAQPMLVPAVDANLGRYLAA